LLPFLLWFKNKKAPLLWCFLFACFLPFHALGQSKDELQALQKQIKQKQQQVARQLVKAKQLQNELKQSELKIASAAKALNKTEQALKANQQDQQTLKKRQGEIQRKLAQQQDTLAKQIRSAFMTGNYDYAKMLLNQENAAKFERTITYYEYLNKARREIIDEFRQLGDELVQVNLTLVEKQDSLQNLLDRQQAQQATLTQGLRSREQTLTKLQSAIETDAAKIEELQANEQNLRKAITEAERLAAQKPTTFDGLAKLKGKLLKPAQGQVRKLFGTKRQGQVLWKGIIVDANAGNNVVAIHHGKVLYADWLRGFGLVIVVDHGKGYMSLYGHNQALLHQTGDTVSAGEPIALVGQSGGQSSPNLYFEIRYKGDPINPTQWLKL
tara:strand:+ start:200364 stop:201512 length:1149 start_codon:yes stop_codon:yes gene_type:complete